VNLPRLIATDLDGTLLRSDGTVSERTRAALKACAAAGIEVVIVTARPPRAVAHLVEQTGCAATAVCSNGAMIHDFALGASTFVHAFTPDEARGLVELLRPALPHDTGFALETGEVSYREAAFRIGRVTAHSSILIGDLHLAWPPAEQFVKVLARSSSATADAMVAAARRAVTDRAEPSHSGGTGLLEIAPPGATKASTLAWLCERRGIDAADVAAFGDMPNDLPMLQWAGAAYAVGNAHPDVLAAVSRVTSANDEDGVAVALEALLSYGSERRGREALRVSGSGQATASS
jgi:Cof subfamily protein (haloacid dehalogenase superfamily)